MALTFKMLEIHKPELERRLREKIQRGQFHDVDDLIEKALDALDEKGTAAARLSHSETPAGKKGRRTSR